MPGGYTQLPTFHQKLRIRGHRAPERERRGSRTERAKKRNRKEEEKEEKEKERRAFSPL